MKKLLLIFIIGVCAFPVQAQKGKIIKGSLGGGAALTDAVTREVAKQTITLPQVYLAQIANMPGKPIVNVRMFKTVEAAAPVLSARILKPSELHRNISLVESLQLYMPDAFYLSDEAAYRGMRLDELDELKNLLIHGLQVKHTHYGEIYAAHNASAVALSYAVPSQGMCIYESFLDGEYQLPVITKIPFNLELVKHSAGALDHRTGWLTFGKDIPASMISDVMIFLEINAHPDWYKVTLENGELVFTPAPSRAVRGILDSY